VGPQQREVLDGAEEDHDQDRSRRALDVLSTGDHYELEAITAGTKGFHDPFLAAIAS